MSTEENKAAIRRLTEERNAGNRDAVDGYYTPDAIESMRETGEAYADLGGAFSDPHITVEDQIAEGDRVVNLLATRATHTGEFMGIAPTGKQITMRWWTIDRFEGGKIVEVLGIMDWLGVYQQLSATPPMEQAEE